MGCASVSLRQWCWLFFAHRDERKCQFSFAPNVLCLPSKAANQTQHGPLEPRGKHPGFFREARHPAPSSLFVGLGVVREHICWRTSTENINRNLMRCVRNWRCSKANLLSYASRPSCAARSMTWKRDVADGSEADIGAVEINHWLEAAYCLQLRAAAGAERKKMRRVVCGYWRGPSNGIRR